MHTFGPAVQPEILSAQLPWLPSLSRPLSVYILADEFLRDAHTFTTCTGSSAHSRYKIHGSLPVPRHQSLSINMFSLHYSTVPQCLVWIICILYFNLMKTLSHFGPTSCVNPPHGAPSGTTPSQLGPDRPETPLEQPKLLSNVQGVVKLTLESLERLNIPSHGTEILEHLEGAVVLLLDLTPLHGRSSIGPTIYRFSRTLLQRDESGNYSHLPNLATLLFHIPKDCWASMNEEEAQGIHNVLTAVHCDHLAAKANSSPRLRARPLLHIAFPSQGEPWQRRYCGEPTEH